MNKNSELAKGLWACADELRANSKLKASEYSTPVLGLIFLRFAEHRFAIVEKELSNKTSRRRGIDKTNYQAEGALYLRPEARFPYLAQLPEQADIGSAIEKAMAAIEEDNEILKGTFKANYQRIDKPALKTLLKRFNDFPVDADGDLFGKIYEYFLGEFARKEGQKGGEFYTPQSLVELIVEILEPYHGKIYDPACGSGGMFVQSAKFVKRHKKKDHNHKYPDKNDSNVDDYISLYGVERVEETRKLCIQNLVVHGLSINKDTIKEANSYYEDPHQSSAAFDFVMANPPFNVDKVNKVQIANDLERFPLGMPKTDNANYLWINLFYSSLNDKGRAGFVMANSASDARQSEMEIRKRLLLARAVDVMVAIGPNFFYTVTLPCTLWFLDKGKANTDRKDKVLFIDARSVYRQIDRAHRKFSPKQIEYLANIVRLYRGKSPEFEAQDDKDDPGAEPDLKETFPGLAYRDVAGLCKVATLEEIEKQNWSLNPGRYVGVADKGQDDFDFAERLEELSEELEVLNREARELEERIAANVAKLLEG
ncbi:MAG: SAM-dependent DNA methyltransferase [Planctomycetia bacterium]|nr:SAM-dependent DNA methyltransferase [Planctomycetia bacterium]